MAGGDHEAPGLSRRDPEGDQRRPAPDGVILPAGDDAPAPPLRVYRDLPETVDISFRKQILLGTPIQCLYARTEDGKHQVEIRSESGGKLTRHAFVWFY